MRSPRPRSIDGDAACIARDPNHIAAPIAPTHSAIGTGPDSSAQSSTAINPFSIANETGAARLT